MMEYSAVAGECVVKDEHGNVIWQGSPEGYKTVWAQSVPGSDDGLVLYDYYRPEKRYGSFQNLVRIRPFGSIIFRAELPVGDDTYVSAEISNGELFANSWGCYRVHLDISTGTVLQRVFTK